MQADAPNAHFTFSPDASAPTAGSDVGVVVVGETPYAEGVGDIGNGHTADSRQPTRLPSTRSARR